MYAVRPCPLTLPGLALLAVLGACSEPAAPPAASAAVDPALQQLSYAASSIITADYLRSITVELSDDRYGGRAPGSAGDKMTQEYLAGTLAALGFQPGDAELAGAELVFVGYGITAPEYGWDDYKDMDLRGKLLVSWRIANNEALPQWEPGDEFAGLRESAEPRALVAAGSAKPAAWLSPQGASQRKLVASSLLPLPS